jgi:pimeloyl-ACP methyl ester carboxylesterase
MPAIPSNGITIEHESFGDPAAPCVILVMGLGMQLIAWPEPFCHHLADHGFRVVRFDNRDVGLSTKLDHLGAPSLRLALLRSLLRLPVRSSYTLDDMARDTLGLMDALAIRRAHLVGASMGGMIAQIMAAGASDRAISLTSIMSSSGARSLPGPTPRVLRVIGRRQPPLRDFDRLVEHYIELWRTIGSPAFPIDGVELRERVSTSLRRSFHPQGTARQMLAIMASGDRSKLLREIEAPTLVIHGRADPLVPLACGEDTARKIPNARLRIVDGMGHDLAAWRILAPDILNHCRRAEARLQPV